VSKKGEEILLFFAVELKLVSKFRQSIIDWLLITSNSRTVYSSVVGIGLPVSGRAGSIEQKTSSRAET